MKTKLFTLALAALTIGLLGSCKKEDPKVSVTGVTLDKTELTLTVGDPDVKLAATIAPEDATDKTVSWSSDKTDVATVDQEGNVHAVGPGTANIIVATTDGNKTATCVVTVTRIVVDITKTVVGAEDCSTPFRGDHSQFFQVPAGQLLHFEFTNHTSKINTWNNWNLVMATTPGTSIDDDPAYAELFVIKSDQSGSGNADYSNERLKIDYFEDGNLADWDEFKEFMDGVHVTIEVDHTTAGYAYITATATNNVWGISITESYNQKVGTDDIYANITTDLSYFQMLSAYRTISKIDEISD